MKFLLKRSKSWLIALLLACVLPLAAQASAADIMTAAELRPGMRGYAKTVVEGTQIETFDLEILGVFKESDEEDGKIIAQASGPLIDAVGGVLQGMSGSPVYIDGRLIGAVSGGWKDIDNRTCIITPIADMLKVWNLPDSKGQSKIKQVNLKPPQKEPAAQAKAPDGEKKPQSDEKAASKDGKQKKEKQKKEKQPSQAAQRPVQAAPAKKTPESAKPQKEGGKAEPKALSTPLLVSGFGSPGLKLLEEKLAPFQIAPYAAGGQSAGSGAGGVLEPGSAIGVQLVRGDISMAAIGTVTLVEDGKVLAFGHPFLRKGNVNYFMTDAQIVATASGASAGFKIGSPGRLLGRINQDRSSAVAGVVGAYPSVIPLEVRVADAQSKKQKTYAMQIAYDEDLAAALVASMVYNAIDKTIDRVGDGTASVAFEIMTSGAPGGKLRRDNMFYNAQDVGPQAISEIFQAMGLLASNAMEEADIVSVKVDVKIDEGRKTASIIEAVPDKASVKAGETVRLKLRLKPYRAAEEILVVPYTVPKHQAPGMLNLEARGGGLVSLAQLLMQQQGIDLSAEEDKTKPLQTMVKEFLETNKNNEIVIAPSLVPEAMQPAAAGAAGPAPVKAAAAKAQEEAAAPAKEDAQKAQSKHATRYIIDNVVRTAIQVTAK